MLHLKDQILEFTVVNIFKTYNISDIIHHNYVLNRLSCKYYMVVEIILKIFILVLLITLKYLVVLKMIIVNFMS